MKHRKCKRKTLTRTLRIYTHQGNDLTQSLLYDRTDSERKTHEDEIRALITTLGARIGDKTFVAPTHDGMMQELKLLQLKASTAVSVG
jgi:hypothetical protein